MVSVGLALTSFIDPNMQAKDWGFHRASRPDRFIETLFAVGTIGRLFVLGSAFKVSPPTLKLLIHKQNLAYASSWRKLCIAVL